MARAPLRWALLAAAAAAAVAAVAASAAAMFIQTTATAPASQVADVAELTVQYTVSNDKYAVVLSRAENVQKVPWGRGGGGGASIAAWGFPGEAAGRPPPVTRRVPRGTPTPLQIPLPQTNLDVALT